MQDVSYVTTYNRYQGRFLKPFICACLSFQKTLRLKSSNEYLDPIDKVLLYLHIHQQLKIWSMDCSPASFKSVMKYDATGYVIKEERRG